MAQLNLLVVGECGDGKSTLVKFLTKGGQKPETGMNADGVTKTIAKYDAGIIGGRAVTILDSPGVGDKHVTPGKLVAMIEDFLVKDKINGVLLCSSISKNRVTLGAKVVALLAEKGFVGDGKWDGFIFVGTQADRCKQKEIKNFKGDTLAKLNEGCKGSITKVAQIEIDEDDDKLCKVQELESLIEQLPGNTLEYKAPDPKELSEGIGTLMGIDPQVIEKEIIKYRGFDFVKDLLLPVATLGVSKIVEAVVSK